MAQLIITRKVPHTLDLSSDLSKAIEVARFALDHPDQLSTKYVRDIGLNAAFADMTLRHYGLSPPVTFREERVKLMIAGSKVPVDLDRKTIYIRPLKATFPCAFPEDFVKVKRVVLDKEFVYINMVVQPKSDLEVEEYMGIDLNIVGPFAVLWIPTINQFFEFGRMYHATFIKYRELINELSEKGKRKALDRVRQRYKNILSDLLHQTSSAVVKLAVENRCGIKMEDLTGIRDKFVLESGKRILLRHWPYFRFRQMIEYKSKRNGVPTRIVSPVGSSRICAEHRLSGRREGNILYCPAGHKIDADRNAAMMISKS